MHELGKHIEQIAAPTLRKFERVVERAIFVSGGPVRSTENGFLPSAPAVDVAGPGSGRLGLEDVEHQHILKTFQHTYRVVEGSKGAALIPELHPKTRRDRTRKLGTIRDDYRRNHYTRLNLTKVKGCLPFCG